MKKNNEKNKGKQKMGSKVLKKGPLGLLLRVLIAISLIASMSACSVRQVETTGGSTETTQSQEDPVTESDGNLEFLDAVYLGVVDESTATRADVLTPGAEVYRFRVGDEEKVFSLACGTAEADPTGEYATVLSADQGAYPIQNVLMKGYSYHLTMENNQVVSAELEETTSGTFLSPVSGLPGQTTLKNFLKTACSALGTVLYVYGGGWDFQDSGSSNMTRTIGLSGSWIDFFQRETADYQYKEDNSGTVYYPVNAWNTYYYAGLDCSGYVGWTLYNTLYTDSLTEPGFVGSSTKMAQKLAETYGFGTFEHPTTGDTSTEYSLEFLKLMNPGDVVSIKRHVYIVVGTCQDGSVLIINSTPSNSVTGAKGGGVQLNAINADGTLSTDCEAYRLAVEYMQKYYPEWAARYPVTMKDPAAYTCFPEEKPSTGIFHWNLDGGILSDPDGYKDMTAEEILADLFG